MSLPRRGALVALITTIAAYVRTLEARPHQTTVYRSTDLWTKEEPKRLIFDLSQFKDFEFINGNRRIVVTRDDVMDALEDPSLKGVR